MCPISIHVHNWYIKYCTSHWYPGPTTEGEPKEKQREEGDTENNSETDSKTDYDLDNTLDTIV